MLPTVFSFIVCRRLRRPRFFRRLDPGKVARGCQRLAGDEAAAAAGAVSHQDTHYTTITKRDKGGGREGGKGWRPGAYVCCQRTSHKKEEMGNDVDSGLLNRDTLRLTLQHRNNRESGVGTENRLRQQFREAG